MGLSIEDTIRTKARHRRIDKARSSFGAMRDVYTMEWVGICMVLVTGGLALIICSAVRAGKSSANCAGRAATIEGRS